MSTPHEALIPGAWMVLSSQKTVDLPNFKRFVRTTFFDKDHLLVDRLPWLRAGWTEQQIDAEVDRQKTQILHCIPRDWATTTRSGQAMDYSFCKKYAMVQDAPPGTNLSSVFNGRRYKTIGWPEDSSRDVVLFTSLEDGRVHAAVSSLEEDVILYTDEARGSTRRWYAWQINFYYGEQPQQGFYIVNGVVQSAMPSTANGENSMFSEGYASGSHSFDHTFGTYLPPGMILPSPTGAM